MAEKIKCVTCERLFGKTTIKHHMKNCKGKKNCANCGISIHPSQETCSYACSNTHFRSGENHPNWKQERYQTTCFAFHKKECVVCGEDKIVAVHHLNEDHDDNRVENLIPMCPTHHQYMHSRYKSEVEHIVTSYIEKFISLGNANR